MTRNRDGALPPGQWDEMIDEIMRATSPFLPGRNGDPKAGMAGTIRFLAGNVQERRTIAQHTLAREMKDGEDVTFYRLLRGGALGELTMCNHIIHTLYYSLVDWHVIKTKERND